MNSSKEQLPNLKKLFGLWTILWVVAASCATTMLWAIQRGQYDAISLGLEHQAELLEGGKDEQTN